MWSSSHRDQSETTSYVWQSGLIFRGVCCLWREQKTQRALYSLEGCVSVSMLFFAETLHSQILFKYKHTCNISICVSHHSLNWRHSILRIPVSTMLNTLPPNVSCLHYLTFSPSTHTYARAQMHTLAHAHGTQWLLFIVHSFMWRALCLDWYSIILQPTRSPSLPFPEGPIDHRPTALMLQHTGFIQTNATTALSCTSASLRH